MELRDFTVTKAGFRRTDRGEKHERFLLLIENLVMGTALMITRDARPKQFGTVQTSQTDTKTGSDAFQNLADLAAKIGFTSLGANSEGIFRDVKHLRSYIGQQYINRLSAEERDYIGLKDDDPDRVRRAADAAEKQRREEEQRAQREKEARDEAERVQRAKDTALQSALDRAAESYEEIDGYGDF